MIADNVRRILDDISNTAIRAGRKTDEVRLVAVTKYVDTDRIAQACDAGITIAGENRVQELLTKEDFFNLKNLSVNLIGQLQTNKVKYVIGKVSLIHSVDRLSLAREIDRLAQARGIVQDVLIQVNIGREPQKGGVKPEELDSLLDDILVMKGVRVKGLMCIPPAVGEREAQEYFAKLRRLAFDTSAKKAQGLEELSMGMSGDYRAAIMEGATLVRIGSAIFGERPQT